MTGCLSARLLSLHRRLSLCRPTAVAPSPKALRPGWRSQWSKHYSVGVKRPAFTSAFLQRLDRLHPPDRPVPKSSGNEVEPWIHILEGLLQQAPDGAAAGSTPEGSFEITQKSFTRSVDLARHLNVARTELDMDLLGHIGFTGNDWSTVHDTLSKLLDAVETLKEESGPEAGAERHQLSLSGPSLDELTNVDYKSSPAIHDSVIPGWTDLDASTYRPFAQDYHKLLMAEVWTTLGAIVISAVESAPVQSKLAMSVVYRILARLHHSGLVPDRIYRYTTPDSHQASFRPSGMHLLSSHIIDVLSDAAWLVHEAELAAKAAAEGKDAPFLPARIDIKELGHNIWMEFILWCCVEHGHIREGVWLANLLLSREETGWKFQSWRPLLGDEELLRKTKIKQDVSTWPGLDLENVESEPRKRTDPPLPFYGLGKRTISVEVVNALLDNLPNLVRMGMGKPGISVPELLRQMKHLRSAIEPTSKELLPTVKAANWLAVRVMESGGMTPGADPQTFDDLIQLTPHVVPPWSNVMYPVAEDSLVQLDPSRLYDDTSAFTGLMEYNLKSHSNQKFCGKAMDSFAMLQAVVDVCKMRRVDEFFSSQARGIDANSHSLFDDGPTYPGLLESSIPQLSNITIAHLFDVITVSRAFAFGEWLLFSDDVDGPTVPLSAYSDQGLAPSLLRFAAATKNNSLGQSVIQSLKQFNFALSNNTYRALVNYHIVLHQWDEVVPIFQDLRDYRSKSWTHSNVATITAEILRTEHSLQQQRALNATSSALADIEASLVKAIKLLYRLLDGEFDEASWRKSRNRYFQRNTMISFTRLFRHLKSRSLFALTEYIFESTHVPNIHLPYIPSPAFHVILAAVAETGGAVAARRLYKRFCVRYSSPEFARMIPGGITRFWVKAERDYRRGNPNFDAEYTNHVRKRMVFPNPNTARIVCQAAVREYQDTLPVLETMNETDKLHESELDLHPTSELDPELISMSKTMTEQDALTETDIETDKHRLSGLLDVPEGESLEQNFESPISDSSDPRGLNTIGDIEAILDYCIKLFESFRMRDSEIAREVGEDYYARYKARVWPLQKLEEFEESLERIQRTTAYLQRAVRRLGETPTKKPEPRSRRYPTQAQGPEKARFEDVWGWDEQEIVGPIDRTPRYLMKHKPGTQKHEPRRRSLPTQSKRIRRLIKRGSVMTSQRIGEVIESSKRHRREVVQMVKESDEALAKDLPAFTPDPDHDHDILYDDDSKDHPLDYSKDDF